MPEIKFADAVIRCEKGENLRAVLMRHQLPLYNGIAAAIHCRGMGTCGTCTVEVQGEISSETKIERWRLNFPPHQRGSGLRLACQCVVLGDLTIKKHDRMWGQKIKPSPE